MSFEFVSEGEKVGDTFKEILLLLTRQNLLIFRQTSQNRFSSAFSLAGRFSPTTEVLQFVTPESKMLYQIRPTTPEGYLCCVYYLQDNVIKMFLLRNLFIDKQVFVDEQHSIPLDSLKHERLIQLRVSEGGFELVTMTNQSVLVLSLLSPRNELQHTSIDRLRLLNKDVAFENVGYNYFFENCYVKFPPDSMSPHFLAYFKDSHLIYALNDLSCDLDNAYVTLLSNEKILVINTATRTVISAKLIPERQLKKPDRYTVEPVDTDLFKRYPDITFIKFFPLSKKKIIIIAETTAAYCIFEVYIPREEVIGSFIFLVEIAKQTIGRNINDYGLIYSLETYNTYRLFFLLSEMMIDAYKISNGEFEKKEELIFDLPIHRISANKKYPYFLVALTKGLEFLFLSNHLEFLCRFSVSSLDASLAPRSWFTNIVSYVKQQTKSEGVIAPDLKELVRQNTAPQNSSKQKGPAHTDNTAVLNGFVFTYLYDGFYLISINDKQMLFELVSHENKFAFRPLKLGEFQLFDLKQKIRNNAFPLKILNVNYKNICYAQGNMLNFGSCQLKPLTPKAENSSFASFNIHKFLLMTKYNYQFFTYDAFFDLLKIRKTALCYQMLLDVTKREQSVQNARMSIFDVSQDLSRSSHIFTDDSSNRRISLIMDGLAENNFDREINRLSFDPLKTEEALKLSLAQFLEQNDFTSEDDFIQHYREVLEKTQDISDRRKDTARRMTDIMQEINQLGERIDYPSRIVFLEVRRTALRREHMPADPGAGEAPAKPAENVPDLLRCPMTSEMVFLSKISEEQDFILKNLTEGKPITFELIKRFCVGTWFENIEELKSIMERAALAEYKERKSAMDVVMWYVILGKHRLLSALFTKEAGQQKFVKFFTNNFEQPENQKKAADNAFILKSQKKYTLCAAFFLLGKCFQEAIEIVLDYQKDIQLATIIMRVFEREIPEDFRREFYHKNFTEKGDQFQDIFTEALGHLFIKDYAQLMKTLGKGLLRVRKVSHDIKVEEELGFLFTGGEIALYDLVTFIQNSPNFKRFLPPNLEMPTPFMALQNKYHYYNDCDQVYLALMTLIEIKAVYPDEFEPVVKANQRKIEQAIMKIAYKKLADLIRKNKVNMLPQGVKRMQSFAQRFGVEPDRLLSKILQRIVLLNDPSLSLHALAISDAQRLQADLRAEKFSIECLQLCIRLLRTEPLSYLPCRKWLNYLSVALAGSELAQELVVNGEEVSQRMDTLITLLAFLLLIHANCYEEALNFIEHSHAVRAQNNAFASLLISARDKTKARFSENQQMVEMRHFSKLKSTYSPTNAIVFLYFQYIFLNNFVSADSYDEMVKAKVTELEPTFPLIVEKYKESLRHTFYEMIQVVSFESQIELIKEIQLLFFEKPAVLRKKTFILFDPTEAISLNENMNVISPAISCYFYSGQLEEYKLCKLFSLPLSELNDVSKQVRKALFGNGVELARFRTESTAFSKAKLAVPSPPAIHLLFQGKLRRISLFESLMRRPRMKEGMLLASEDDPNSVQTTLEQTETIN